MKNGNPLLNYNSTGTLYADDLHDNYYQKTVATAWALTDIDTKYGEKIKFGYTSRLITGKYKSQAVINTQNSVSTNELNTNANTESSALSYTVFALTNIITPTERIEFTVSTNSFFANKIEQINIYNAANYALVRRIQFYYSRVDGYPSGYTFLDSVKVFGGDLVDSQTYGFDYYNRNLPSNTILVPDQWGYNKIEPSIYHLLHNEFKTDIIDAGLKTLNQEKPGYYSDRAVNSNPEIFSLKSVSYPKGGKTVYEYEPNKILYSINQSGQSGGIRIKTITHYDGEIAKLKRTYKYGLNEDGNGGASYYLDHTDFRREYAVFSSVLNNSNTPTSSENLIRALDYTSYPQGDPIDLDSRIYYPFVAEYISSAYNDMLTNGKTVFKYNLQHPISSRVPYPGEILNDQNGIMQYQWVGPTFISRYEYWKKPLLIEKSSYSATNVLVKKETYTYMDKSYPTFKGFKVRPFARVDGSFNQYLPYYYLSIGSFYNYGVYEIETGLSLLQQKEEMLYSESGPIATTTTYSYNPHNQVVAETATDSKNQTIERRTVYSSDKSGWGGVFTRMFQVNALNEVLEQSVVKNNNTVSQVSTDYTELPGEIFVPSKIQKLNTTTQTLDDALLFHRYDNKGNVLSVSKASDVPISYIWSYKSSLPIAQVKGATYEAIENILGAAALQEFSTRANPAKSEVDQFLAPLRTAVETGSLPLAELQSFSYDPVVGLKSQTDARGRTSFYEYNGMGQLTLVRDHDGLVTKKYQYNYQGQPESLPSGCISIDPNWANVGSVYCETSNGANTGRQLQNQVDNNVCSPSYNSQRTVVVATNTTSCPMPVYAKVTYENYYSYPPYEYYADVVVRFYSDAACQNPVSVTDLELNYTITYFDGVGYSTYNETQTANGSESVLSYSSFVGLYDGNGVLYYSEAFTLRPGNYIIVL